ncbi:hypothetical protein ACOSQ4_028568 [Xanthoceras sorbifolium]
MFTEDRTANKVPFGPFARESPPDFYSELKSNACTPPELVLASPVTGSYENVVHMLRCRRLAGKRTGK